MGFQLLNEEFPLGSRPHKAHVTVENIPQLGQLVHAPFADEVPHPGNAVIIGLGPHRPAHFLGIGHHGAKLVHLVWACDFPDPILGEDHPALWNPI